MPNLNFRSSYYGFYLELFSHNYLRGWWSRSTGSCCVSYFLLLSKQIIKVREHFTCIDIRGETGLGDLSLGLSGP